jgi:RNA polymerase primary sigma factor
VAAGAAAQGFRAGQREGASAHGSRDQVYERKLLKAARRGDHGARARLVECNLPLVRRVAARYRDFGLPFEDLVQEGAIGLMDAVDHYDPSRTVPFEAYARFRIRRAMRNALTDQARLIRLPKQIVERRRALQGAEARLLAAGKSAEPGALAAATGLSRLAIVQARAAQRTPLSLHDAFGADGPPAGAILSAADTCDPADQVVGGEQVAALERALARLPERQRRIVVGQWGLNGEAEATTTDLAHDLSLSPRRTLTLGREALDVLRRELDPEVGNA